MPPRPQPATDARHDNRRDAAKDATRAALIAAAIAEFGEHGLTAPSLDAIAARAGYTRGAFYVHFKDRDALIVAVMDHLLGRFLATLGAGAAATGDVDDAIRGFAAAAARRDPVVHAGAAVRFHHLLEACRTSPRVGDRYRALLVALRGQLAQAFAASGAHPARARSPLQLAQLVVAAGLGLVAMIDLDLEVDPVELGDTAIALLAAARPRSRRRRRARRAE